MVYEKVNCLKHLNMKLILITSISMSKFLTDTCAQFLYGSNQIFKLWSNFFMAYFWLYCESEWARRIKISPNYENNLIQNITNYLCGYRCASSYQIFDGIFFHNIGTDKAWYQNVLIGVLIVLMNVWKFFHTVYTQMSSQPCELHDVVTSWPHVRMFYCIIHTQMAVCRNEIDGHVPQAHEVCWTFCHILCTRRLDHHRLWSKLHYWLN